MGKKLNVALTLLAVTVSVSIYIVIAQPGPTQVSAIQDSDGDGIRDDEDFFDHGNGGVRIRVASFQGECGNWWGPCKPIFEVGVDTDYDGDYDVSERVGPLVGNDLVNPFNHLFDVPDSATKIRFKLVITDDDGGEKIDWTNDRAGQWGYLEVALPTDPQSWSQSGTDGTRAKVSISLTVEGL